MKTWLLAILFAAGCNGSGKIDPEDVAPIDGDLDGYTVEEDCDDTRSQVHPDHGELCDGLDNDCDNDVDEEPLDPTTSYPDTDGDGYGDLNSPVQSCTVPDGNILDGSDCNDGNPEIRPDATEACNGDDDDCDDVVDEDLIFTDYYPDLDEDGQGDANAAPVSACAPVPNAVPNADDCDDGDANVFLEAVEICNGRDDDCQNGVDDGLTFLLYYSDIDGDGFGNEADPGTSSCAPIPNAVLDNTDCDDGEPLANPGLLEVCPDGIDNNCNLAVDEDVDGDGDGVTTCGGDCDDGNIAIFPTASERCNGVDDNCDLVIDTDATDKQTFFEDGDGDGFGNVLVPETACAASPGFVVDGTDCDDTLSSVYPGAVEVCNGQDDDCDSAVPSDEDDTDGDLERVCEGDCDDTRADVNTSAPEVCDGVTDEDCDGTVDENLDADGDGITTCAGDCDDGNVLVYPGAPETCDGEDEDCDGALDNGLATSPWYRDADGDGFGDMTASVIACAAPTDYVADATDCDDNDPGNHPGVVETVDGEDNDCNGLADDGTSVFDDDGDGFAEIDGDCDDGDDTIAPGLPDTWYDGIDSDCAGDDDYDQDGDGERADLFAGLDCDDLDPLVNTSATDVCDDATDNDCDGVSDNGTTDVDGDGFVDDTCVGGDDCDDGDLTVNPTAIEMCDTVDNDCDGLTDAGDPSIADIHTYYPDTDGDGYGDSTGIPVADCSAPPDYVEDATDCDDARSDVNPGASEVCDGFTDEDCDGTVDENLDVDGDGETTCAGDCDDNDITVNTSGVETCDGDDENCDGTIDETTSCYDDDGDGESEDDGDCDDADPARFSTAIDDCDDAIDQDCDGTADNGPTDADLDGFVDALCVGGDDCDDGNDTIYPGAPDTWYDGIDSDCALDSDYDQDGDGSDSDLYSGTDCDDTTVLVDPTFATELDPGLATDCHDFLDNECDGEWDFADDTDCVNATGYVATGASLLTDGGFESGTADMLDLPTGHLNDDAGPVVNQDCSVATTEFFGCRLVLSQTTASADWYSEAVAIELTGLTVGDFYLLSFVDKVDGGLNNRLVISILEGSAVGATTDPRTGDYTGSIYTSSTGAFQSRVVAFEATETTMYVAFAFGELQMGDTELIDQIAVRPTL